MSNLDDFRKLVLGDESLSARVRAADSLEDLHAISIECGFNIDIQEFIPQIAAAEDVDLSSVTGGINTTVSYNPSVNNSEINIKGTIGGQSFPSIKNNTSGGFSFKDGFSFSNGAGNSFLKGSLF